MKIGKLHKASGTLKVLLGLAVAGALLFASCQDIFDAAEQKTKDDSGGYVLVDLGDVARTIRPGLDNNFGNGSYLSYEVRYIVYTFTGVNPSTGEPTGIVLDWTEDYQTNRNNNFFLPKGTYELLVEAYSNTSYTSTGGGTAYRVVAKGNYKAANGGKTFEVLGGGTITVSVGLEAVNVDNQNGALAVSIALDSVSGTVTGVFTLEQYVGTTKLKEVANFTSTTIAWDAGSSTFKTSSDFSLPPGTYRFTARFNTTNAQFGGFSEAVHIVSNITTRILRSSATKNLVELVQVNSSSEAIDILKSEIKSWVTPKAVLAYGDPVYDDTAKTITLNYLADELNKLSTPGNFPLGLQGGWQVKATNDSVFPVTNNSNAFTFILNNPSVPDISVTNSPPTEYTVILMPVAQYQVWYGKGVDKEGGRGVTIKDGTKDVTLTGAQSEDEPGIGISGIATTGSTIVINTTNAAITIDGAYTPVDAQGVVTPAITAVSKVYKIAIYQTVAAQEAAALELLQSEADLWVKNQNALAKEGKKGIVATTDLISQSKGGVILYYVYSRLNPGYSSTAGAKKFEITLPNDDRWSNVASYDWNVTVDENVIDRTKVDKMQVGFKAYGGQSIVFDVHLRPVAEFTIDFAPETWQKTNPTADGYGTDPDNDSVTITGGSVIIKDSDTNIQQDAKFEATTRGKRFSLGTSAVTLANVAIMLDDNVQTTTGFDNFTNAYILTTGANPARPTTLVKNDNIATSAYSINSPTVFAALNPGSTITPAPTTIGATSREYTIKVYKSIPVQEKEATDRLALLSSVNDTNNWISGGASPSTRKVAIPFTTSSVQTNELPRSYMVYVGAEPTIERPTYANNPYTWVNNSSNGTSYYHGWDTVTDPALSAGAFVKNVAVNFKSFGGESVEIYTFRVHAAAEFNINFEKVPVGNEITSAIIKVEGNSPWETTNASFNKDFNSGNGNAVNQLIGLGGTSPTIKFTAQPNGNFGNNVLGYPNTYESSSGDGSIKYTAQTMTISEVGSKAFTVSVYPSVDNQTTAVRDALKAISSINGWVPSPNTNNVKIETLKNSTNNAQGALDSEFQIVSSPALGDTSALALSLPGGFLNTPYQSRLTVTAGSATVGTAYAAATGKRSDVVKFVPLSKDPTSTTAADYLSYTFNLVQVAKYTVKFNRGPDKDIVARGQISVQTYNPGAGAPTTGGNPIQSVVQDPSGDVVIIGGIGTSNTAVIRSPDGNAFIVTGTGISSPDYVDGSKYDSTNSATTAANGTFALSAVSSQEYTINVYPSVVDQNNQVLNLLRKQTGPLQNTSSTANDGWFVTIPNNSATVFRGTTITPITGTAAGAGVTSEVQYIWGGTDVPTVKVPTNFLWEGYRSGDNALSIVQTSVTGANGGNAVFGFQAKGETTPNASFYTFKLTPVVQYNVVYSGLGVQGAIYITPPGASQALPAIFESSSASDKTAYTAVGASTIRIDADSTKFTKVTVVQGNNALELRPGSLSGSFTASSGVVTITVTLGN